jgi:hypothetical protein
LKDQNVLQAMSRYLLKHTWVLVHFLLSTEMKNRNGVLERDKLLMYDQDDSVKLVFVAGEMIVELDSLNHFVYGVLEYQ